jgi:hypothetical protein
MLMTAEEEVVVIPEAAHPEAAIQVVVILEVGTQEAAVAAMVVMVLAAAHREIQWAVWEGIVRGIAAVIQWAGWLIHKPPLIPFQMLNRPRSRLRFHLRSPLQWTLTQGNLRRMPPQV